MKWASSRYRTSKMSHTRWSNAGRLSAMGCPSC